MAFSEEERQALLTLKGIGPTVINRLEEIGIDSFLELRKYHADDIAQMVANRLNSSCWKNSPLARAAIDRAINLAKA